MQLLQRLAEQQKGTLGLAVGQPVVEGLGETDAAAHKTERVCCCLSTVCALSGVSVAVSHLQQLLVLQLQRPQHSQRRYELFNSEGTII